MRQPMSLRSGLRLLPPLLLFLFGLLPSARAAALRSAQVVVLETRTAGDVRPEERARLGDALWAALDRLGLRRVPDTDREAVLQGEAGLRACLDRDDCLERLGRLLEATHVISAQVVRTAPTAYKVEVRLFDVDVGQNGALIEWSCTGCGIEDVGGKLDTLVESAVQKDNERPRATLLIRSSPPNADVQIDGRKVGFTELERRVFAGPHDIVVSLDRLGLSPEHMHIEVSAEQRLVLSLSPGPPQKVEKPEPVAQPSPVLVPVPPPARGVERHSRWKLGLGIPLLVAGLGVGGLGVASLLLDGRCIDNSMPCDKVFDSKLAGYIEIGVGAAAAVTGVALIIADGVEERRLQRRQRELSLSPVGPRGSSGLSLSYSF